MIKLQRDKRTLFPAFEVHIQLTRNLYKTMLLYQSSGWVHHDFRL
jgi:hypothetical protein